MCRCQVSRAAFGSARSALGTEVARGPMQADRHSRSVPPVGRQPFRTKKNQSINNARVLTRSALTSCVEKRRRALARNCHFFLPSLPET